MSCIDGLLSGLKLRHFPIMSRPSEGQLVNQSFRLTGFIFVRMSTISLPKSVLRDFRSLRVGGPVHWITL